jgi:hypothetical protein
MPARETEERRVVAWGRELRIIAYPDGGLWAELDLLESDEVVSFVMDPDEADEYAELFHWAAARARIRKEEANAGA